VPPRGMRQRPEHRVDFVQFPQSARHERHLAVLLNEANKFATAS